MLTAREKILLQRVAQAGIELDRGVATGGFELVVTPVVSVGVDATVLYELGKQLSRANGEPLTSRSLQAIVFFPIVLDPKIASKPDFAVYKSRRKSYYVGRNIKFEAWDKGRRVKRIELASVAFAEALMMMDDKKFAPEEKLELMMSILDAAQAIR